MKVVAPAGALMVRSALMVVGAVLLGASGSVWT